MTKDTINKVSKYEISFTQTLFGIRKLWCYRLCFLNKHIKGLEIGCSRTITITYLT